MQAAVKTSKPAGVRICGLWIQHDETVNLDYVTFVIGERRFRMYIEEPTHQDSPDASLWIKRNVEGGTKPHAIFLRLTGLWSKESKGGSKYFFLSLQEGNFRIYMNTRNTIGTNSPQFALYQYTDANGMPIEAAPRPDERASDQGNDQVVDGKQEDVPF